MCVCVCVCVRVCVCVCLLERRKKVMKCRYFNEISVNKNSLHFKFNKNIFFLFLTMRHEPESLICWNSTLPTLVLWVELLGNWVMFVYCGIFLLFPASMDLDNFQKFFILPGHSLRYSFSFYLFFLSYFLSHDKRRENGVLNWNINIIDITE